MILTYDIHAAKKATNLSINSDLLNKAKALKINLSKNFESYLNQLVREQEEKKWIEENSKAIETFNKRIEETGMFSDGLRSF